MSIIFIVFLLSLNIDCSENKDNVSLKGTWQYAEGFDESYLSHPEKLQWRDVEVPFDFRRIQKFSDYTGYLTVRKKFPESIQSRIGLPLSIFLNQLCDVSEIYINTTKIGSLGTVEPYHSAMYRDFLGDIPQNSLLNESDNFLNIVLYAKEGTPLYIAGPDLYMGPAADVYEQYYIQEILSLSLIVFYIIAGLYHLLLFYKRRSEFEYLLFGITAF
ncbi:MAG: hypothetical protein OEZ34_14550 [Spirochaetia bacterium]|nr:hypothetical protein [Spirochaetia bacterium]